MTVAIDTLRDAPFGVRTCNNFLSQFHDITMAVPTPQIQRELAQVAGGPLPPPITTIAHADKTIVGAATCWVPIPLLMTAAQLHGTDVARELVRNVRALTFMAVAPTHRNRGIGRDLVQLLEQESIRSGAHTIYGFAEDLPEPSWPFYQQLGYTIHDPTEILYFDGIPTGQTPGRVGKLFRKELA